MCEHCGLPFVGSKRWQRFCSERCQRKERNERVKAARRAARKCPCGAPAAHETGVPRCAKCKRATRLGYERRNSMGVSPEEFEERFNEQGRACAICGSTGSQRKGSSTMAADHCHTTGVFRGVLCHKCNIALGLFEDNPILLAVARDYLLLAASRGARTAWWASRTQIKSA